MMGTLADLYSINAAYLVPMVSFASVTVFAYSELDGRTPTIPGDDGLLLEAA
jgi:hypothetical protein